MQRALDVSLDTDLRPLLTWLRAHGVPAYVSEEGGRQVLWVRDSGAVPLVTAAWERYQTGALPEAPVPDRPAPVAVPTGVTPRQAPLTLGLLALALGVTVAVWLGGEAGTRLMFWLTFEPVVPLGDGRVTLQGVGRGLADGEWWRLLTPVFLHFGVLHLVFNLLWTWELGRHIEAFRGGRTLLGLFFAVALVSNSSQYLAGVWLNDRGLFGGLSGVIYGWLGYLWAWNRVGGRPSLPLQRGIFAVMVGWLLLCLSGLVTLAGFGRIANAAHISGLLTGLAWGALGAAWQKRGTVR